MTLRAGLSLKDQVRLGKLTGNLFAQHFPGGKQQVESEANELHEVFQSKYSPKQALDVLSYAVCYCWLAKYVAVDEEVIISAIKTRVSGTVLSDDEARKLYAYVQERQARQIPDAERNSATLLLLKWAKGILLHPLISISSSLSSSSRE
jgi:hypothetical protein